jgi:hypothetical protein
MGDKQNRPGFLDKFKQTDPKKLAKNKKLFWFTFWSVFIGSSVFVAIPIWLKSLSEKPANQPKEEIKVVKQAERLKAIRYLENKKREIYARAWESSIPKIEKLRKEITSDVANYTEVKLNWYFNDVESKNVDRFLDWLYSLGTDYKIAIFTAKEQVEKFFSSRECLENSNLDRCKDLVKPSGYLEEQISKYLLNPNDLENYLKTEILPYHRQKLNEFINKIPQILKVEIEKTAEEELKRKFPYLDEKAIKETVRRFMRNMEYNLRKLAVINISKSIVGTVITLVSAKIVAKIGTKIATKIAEKTTAKMATKAGSKVTGAGGAFALGAGACIEFGPLAFLCGAAAALAATVATDYVINKLDELISRDDLKKELIGYLEESKTDLYSELMKNFENSVNSIEAEMGQKFAI